MNTSNYNTNPAKNRRYLASEIQQEIQAQCRRPRKARDSLGNVIVLPCNSPTCPCEYCRRIAARRISNKHQHDASIEPMTYYGTLSYSDHANVSDPDRWASIRRKIMQTLRQHRRRQVTRHSIRLRFRVEFTPDGKADVNIFVKTTFPSWRSCKAYIRPIIRQASNTNSFKIYLRPPQSQVAVIKYATKDMIDRSTVSCPPSTWKGRRLETGNPSYFHPITQSKYTVSKRDRNKPLYTSSIAEEFSVGRVIDGELTSHHGDVVVHDLVPTCPDIFDLTFPSDTLSQQSSGATSISLASVLQSEPFEHLIDGRVARQPLLESGHLLW